MKKTLMILFCCLMGASMGFAQNEMTEKGGDVSAKEFERYLDKRLEMEYRTATLETLGLTSDEIIAFDPLFSAYRNKREALIEKKMNLLEEFNEEMDEDDSKANQDEDRADFIEDYWEVEIDEMELKKEFFDKIEDLIPVDKAAKFFIWEEAVESELKQNIFVSMMPTVVALKRIPLGKINWDEKMKDKEARTKIDKAVKDFGQWVSNTKRGVDLSHEYTYTGLKHLVNTLTTVKNAAGVYIPSFDKKKDMIMTKAEKLKKDPYDTDHADMTREAFIATAQMMYSFDDIDKVSELVSVAREINPDELMTKQASTIYKFFDMANKRLMSMTQMAHHNKNKSK